MNKIPLFRKFMEIQAWAQQRAISRISRGVKGRDGRSDFFTHFLEAPRDGENRITEQEMMSNALLLVVAGSDTSATALVGLFFYLAQNRQVYGILKEEIRSKFTTESDIDFRNCALLAFLNACIEETLRIYPPSPEIPTRISPGDVINGHNVPADTCISVHLSATCRSPDHFVEPDCFRPQRWLPENHPQYGAKFGGDRLSVCKPFSYGPRDCLGQKLAFAEIRLVTARLLHRFDFDLLPGQDDWQAKQRMFIVWDKPPLYLRFRPR
ncbi:cytochrome p450 [Hirsutella rhossiliensis]